MIALEPYQRSVLQRVDALLRQKRGRAQARITEEDLYDLCRVAVQEAGGGLSSAARPEGTRRQLALAPADTILAATIVRTYLAQGWSWTLGRKQWSGLPLLGSWRRHRLLSLAAVAQSVAALREQARRRRWTYRRSAARAVSH